MARLLAKRLNEELVIAGAKTAIVTIDCHRGHLDPSVATLPLPADRAQTVVANIQRLLVTCRLRSFHVIHVIQQNRRAPGSALRRFGNPYWRALAGAHQQLGLESHLGRHNLADSVQTELMPELGPEPDDIVIDSKRRLSIFRDTDLDLVLHEIGVDTLVLVGVNTNTCVQCAAFETLNRDLRAVVISDCVDSMYGDDLHKSALKNIGDCLGWVLGLDEFLDKTAG